MNVIADLFPGFAEHRLSTEGAEIFVRGGRSGPPPLLLLHGYPQTKCEAWQAWCTKVSGVAVRAGHLLAEENPQATLAALIPFLKAHAGSD